MSNVYGVYSPGGTLLVTMLSRDYQPDDLVQQYGPIQILDHDDDNRLVDALPEGAWVYVLELTAEDRRNLARLVKNDYKDTKQVFGALPMGVELQEEAEALHQKLVKATPKIKERA